MLKLRASQEGLEEKMTDDEIMDKVLGSSRAFKPGRGRNLPKSTSSSSVCNYPSPEPLVSKSALRRFVEAHNQQMKDWHAQLADKNIELRLPAPLDPNALLEDDAEPRDAADVLEDAANVLEDAAEPGEDLSKGYQIHAQCLDPLQISEHRNSVPVFDTQDDMQLDTQDDMQGLVRDAFHISNENTRPHKRCKKDDKNKGTPNAHEKKINDVLEESKKELYPGCKNSVLSFIHETILVVNCIVKSMRKGLYQSLDTLRETFPDASIPRSFYEMKKVIRDLGLSYDKIDACPNDYSPAWKTFDFKYPDFAKEPRNVRLGLASDGFNPFRNMSTSHSTWPVVLMPYNLPPWMCMKKPYLMLSLLIPGPSAPGNNIDVYLEPLVEELKELWDDGDRVLKDKKSFDGTNEIENPPPRLTGLGVIEELNGYDIKLQRKEVRITQFYPLLEKEKYRFEWRTERINLLRHNLDVMNIEKNVCESIVGTLMNLDGKTKDHIKARLDLQEMGIRPELHP
ncbi:uncharacterized protein Tco_0956952 [Tanacetum coccineum]